MVRFYLVPVESSAGHRGPKYFAYRGDPDAPALISANWQGRDYGDEPLMLVAADLSLSDDALLAAQPDVTKFADNLDQALGADLTEIQNALEATNLPAEMLTAGMTHRTAIRGIMGIFGLAQSMQSKGYRVFGGAVTLSTTVSSLALGPRTALQDGAASLGYDQIGITGASTIRQALAKIVQQATPDRMMGVTV